MTPERLLVELEGLSHNQRIARMVHLGRESLTNAAAADCLSRLEHAHGLYGKILALHAAHGSRDSAVVLRSFNASSRTLRDLAVFAAPRVADDATVAQIWKSGEVDSEAYAKRLRGRRRGLVDAHVRGGWPATASLLGSCSLQVVEELWPMAVGSSLASETFPSVARCHPGFAVRVLGDLSGKLQKAFLSDASVIGRVASEYPEETLAAFMRRPYTERPGFLWMPILRKLPNRALDAMLERAPAPEAKEGAMADDSPPGVAACRIHATERNAAIVSKLWRLCRRMNARRSLEVCLEAPGTAVKVMRKLDARGRRELFCAWKDWRQARLDAIGWDGPGGQEEAFRSVRDRAWALAWSRNPFVSPDVVKYLPVDLRLEAVQLLARHGRPSVEVMKTLTEEQVRDVFRAHGGIFVKHPDLLGALPEPQKREAYERWKVARGHAETVCEAVLGAVPAAAAGSPEMRCLLDALIGDPMQQSMTVRLLPEDVRGELYDRSKHSAFWTVGAGALQLLPKEQ
eukprot:evm.model.scf_527.1 EVM.evm.TU.scf_527.1   scf_527:6903-8443(-)